MDYKKFTKAYDCIMTDKKIGDLCEAYMLCKYIEKYVINGKIITSDQKDAEMIFKSDKKYARKRREHLKEIGYIDYKTKKGKSTEIIINNGILKAIGVI